MSNVLEKTARQRLTITALAAGLSSVALSVIPYAPVTAQGKPSVIAYIAAAIFWLGLILTLVTSWLTARMLARVRERLINKGSLKKKTLPGIISFSPEPMNMILYTLALIGTAVSITDIIYDYIPEKLMFPILSVTVFCFELHCILDGRNVKVYKLIKESVNDETISKV